MTCGHCVAAVTEEVSKLDHVESRRRRSRERCRHRRLRRPDRSDRVRCGGRRGRIRDRAVNTGDQARRVRRRRRGRVRRRGGGRRCRRADRCRHGTALTARTRTATRPRSATCRGALPWPRTGIASSSTPPTSLPATSSPFGFAIVDDDGAPVTAFDQLHERAVAPDRSVPQPGRLPPSPPDDGLQRSLDRRAAGAWPPARTGCSPTSNRSELRT